jgi:hypothetical protein
MKAVDRETLLALAAHSEWPCVSLYLPLDHQGVHTDADRIRLRNLIKKATERLVHDGLRAPAAEAMLAAVVAIAGDETAWKGGPAGVAFFVSPQSTETVWVDVTLPELDVVGDRFYLRPLYAAYTGEKKAWALALDSNKTRLFHLDPMTIEEVELPKGVPTSLAEEERFDQGEDSLQYHSVPGATPEGVQGTNTPMYHGHGGEKDYDKVARGQFMLQLSRGVMDRIGAQSAEPLVLLGVDYMIEEFRAASDYAHIASEKVDGATDYLSPSDVQRKVLAALMPRMKAAGAASVEEFKSLTGTGKTSTDASEIVAAAAAGKVKTLIMDDSSGPWGWFDKTTFGVTNLCELEPRLLRAGMGAVEEKDTLECGWDLIDLAAAETFKHGGEVLAFRGEASPISGAAAVYRY